MRNLIIKWKVQTSNGNVNGEPSRGWLKKKWVKIIVYWLRSIYSATNKIHIYIFIGIKYVDIGLNMS